MKLPPEHGPTLKRPVVGEIAAADDVYDTHLGELGDEGLLDDDRTD